MKTILLTNHYIKNFTGSELAIYDLARTFLNSNYDVTVGAFILGEPLGAFFRAAGVRVVDLKKLYERYFDLIWGQHFTTIDFCLIDLGIRADKIIFSSLSPFELLEMPPLSMNAVDLFLANSLETKRSIVRSGISSSRIHVFANPIPSVFFESRRVINKLNRIAIISNHCPEEVFDLIGLLESYGIIAVLFGVEGQYQLITPEDLSKFDAVITIGRSVQYCLAQAIPVYCYDRFGGPGWIVANNIRLSAESNFSGRCVPEKKTSQNIVDELLDGFYGALASLNVCNDYAREHFNIELETRKLLEKIYYRKSKKRKRGNDLIQLFIKHRKYYLSEILAEKDLRFVQLFWDTGKGFNEKESIRLPCSEDESCLYGFDLSGISGAFEFRFDPLNDYCVIELKKIEFIDCNENTYSAQNISSNVFNSNGNKYVFHTNDPQLIFNGPENATNLVFIKLLVEFVLINKGEETLSELNSVISQEIGTLRQQLEEFETSDNVQINDLRAQLSLAKVEIKKLKLALKKNERF